MTLDTCADISCISPYLMDVAEYTGEMNQIRGNGTSETNWSGKV